MNRYFQRVLMAFLLLASAMLHAETATSVSQYGITWTFDKPCTVGKFVTGDWWVIGPVNIVKVDPAAGPVPESQAGVEVKGRYGASEFVADPRMRNASVIIKDTPEIKKEAAEGHYGLGTFFMGYNNPWHREPFDSRMAPKSTCPFDPAPGLKFPYTLAVNESMVSTISAPPTPVPRFGHEVTGYLPPNADKLLSTAAVLTCLDKAPPADAFRPAYAGSDKKIYQAKDIHWDLLPNLALPTGNPDSPYLKRTIDNPPSWPLFERYFQRPWLDTTFNDFLGPNENNAVYGREYGRIMGSATLMLMTNVPREHKQKLLYGVLQVGIDLRGLMNAGRNWVVGGCIGCGRKWPLIFTGMMLNAPSFYMIPLWSGFDEDAMTYYGKAWNGETALWQMVFHTGISNGQPFQETPLEQWGKREAFASQYMQTNSETWPAECLAALLMKAKANWNHDAFFDYCDRWMRGKNEVISNQKLDGVIPAGKVAGHSYDAFVDAMWKEYRSKVPDQPGGKDNLKWVLENPTDRKSAYGMMVPNPKPDQK